jgi:octaprenyl-diphosphate synthase
VAEIFDLIRADLDQVEEELTRQASLGIRPVAEIARYLQAGGGKRLRPAVHLLAAKFCGYEGSSAIKLGAVLELIHAATLIHDDVIDAADTRRGQPSSNRRWGNSMTVLAGDWLYMQAFRIALDERNFRILDLLIDLTQTMVEGELLQLEQVGRVDITEAEALEISRRKTACLFGVAMQLAALLGTRSRKEEELLWQYGLNAGMAFQVIDDLLDFTADPVRLGKPVVNDLREGKVTLPLVYALAASDGRARAQVETVLREQGFVSVPPEQIRALVRESGAVAQTRSCAQQYLTTALGCLDLFPDSPYKRALEAVPQFILERDH